MKVGIIGAGLIGTKRAESITSLGDQVIAIADVEYERAKILAEKAGGIAYREWYNIINNREIQAIVIATPNKWIQEIAIAGAAAGKNVLCEKPLGRNIQEAEKIYSAALENRVMIKTGFNHRHHPAIYKAHELAMQGAIGEIRYIRCVYGHGGRPGYEKEWRASREICGGGELLDQGVHVVDLFRWFLGEFNEAFGLTPTIYWKMEVEDNAFAVFKKSSGQLALMHTSWTQWKNKFLFEIFGCSGYMIIDGLGGSYGTEKLIIGSRRTEENRFIGGAPVEEVLEFPGPDTSWQDEWKEFISAIDEKRSPLGSGYDGLMANKMIDAVYRSVKSNCPVII